jgi:hypothetical protein
MPTHARSISNTCEGKIEPYSLSAYTTAGKDMGDQGEEKNECVFITASSVGKKILKTCPMGSWCRIDASLEDDHGTTINEITMVKSVRRIDTPAEKDPTRRLLFGR